MTPPPPAGDDASLEDFLRRLEHDLKTARRSGSEPVLREVGGELVPPEKPAHRAGDEDADADAESRFGLARIRVERDDSSGRWTYVVDEPRLSEAEARVLEFLKDTLVRTLRGFPEDDSDDAREKFLLDRVEEILADHGIALSDEERLRVEYYLLRNLIGYDRVHAMLHDAQVEDISCDGPGIPIYVFHRKHGSIRSNVQFPDDASLNAFVIRTAQRCGKHISIANPLLDATLPDGSRLQATLAREVTSRGSSFTIRRFRDVPVSPIELIRFGTISPEVAAFYWLAVEEGMSAIVAGGTASGKTTSLNAMSLFIPPDRKIVSIEDTREINIPHENWIAGVTRAGFAERADGGKAGAIDTFKLLEAALRQRPEYILVGEVRGREAFTLFQAMATGHATYATMHADSAPGAVRRLENPPISVPRLMLGGLDILTVQIQTRYQGRAVRRVKEVVEFLGTDPETGELLTNTLFRWDPRSDSFYHASKSFVLEKVSVKKGLDLAVVEEEWRTRALLLTRLTEEGVTAHDDVADVIQQYYADADGTLRAHGIARFEPDEPLDDADAESPEQGGE